MEKILKISLILKIIGLLHILAGVFLFGFILMPDEISSQMIGAQLLEIMPWFKTPVTVVSAMNLGVGILLILSSALKDFRSMKLILLGEVYLMCCIFLGAIFNYFSSFTAIGPPVIIIAMILINLAFTLYGYYYGR